MVTPVQITKSIPPKWVGNEYGSVCAFNSDNSRILLIAVDHFVLLDGLGVFIKDLPIGASQEPRWSGDPSVFYYLSAQTLMRYDLVVGQSSLVRYFPEYSKISGRGESDISADLDHLVFCGTRLDGTEEVFVYEISTNKKGQVFPQTVPFDGLKIGPLNQIILSRSDGIWIVMDTPRQITQSNGHVAVCSDEDGSSILVWTNNQDNAVYKVRLDNGEKTKLLDLNWSLAVDISACNQFALVSTYGKDAEGLYANQILKVEFDGRIDSLCATGSRAIDYNAQPKASLSRDGSRFVFSSNSGNMTPDYCDVWLGIISTPPDPGPGPGWKEIEFTEGEWLLRAVDGRLRMYARV